MKVRFWGVRGSIPAPLSPSAIEAKIVAAIRNLPSGLDPRDEAAVRAYVAALSPLARGTAGGNTACVEVRGSDTTLIIDAGSGIRQLGLELMRGPCGRGQGTVHLLISHPHWDHIQGFPFFSPAFIPGNRILIYSVHDLRSTLDQQQNPINFPIPLSYMRASIEFMPLVEDQPFVAGEFNIETLRNAHPGTAFSFRISDRHSTLVYASDAEYKDLSVAALAPQHKFFRNADAIVFDAQYTLKEAWQKVDWGHSSAMIGVDLARAAMARRLILFHHDPTYSDQELEAIGTAARSYQAQDETRPPVELLIGYEGLSIDLTPAGTVDMTFLRDSQAAVLKPTSIFDEVGVAQVTRQIASIEQLISFDSTIIDLSQVETLTTAGLKALVHLSYERDSGPLVLVNPAPNVQEVIRIGGYSDFFAIYPSFAVARAARRLRDELNLPGHLLKGRYRIEERVGVSRLGTALRATDTTTGQRVAIKVISPTFSPETLARLVTQAPKLTALRHPNLRQIMAIEQEGDTTFIVFEWFEQVQTLEKLLAEQPMRLDAAIRLAIMIAQALSYLHSHGLVHGDLQANNFYFTERGLKINNLSIGRLEERRSLRDAPLILLNAAYLAPEQINGQPLTAASDLYALGVILYQLFTGRQPYSGSDQELMQAHLAGTPIPPRQHQSAISIGLEHLIMRLLDPQPSGRYAEASQVAHILSSLATTGSEIGPLRQQPLVGRDQDLADLLSCWQQASQGHGQLAFISGEPGIGKTSLAYAAAQFSAEARVLIGRCQNLPPTQVYGPIIEIMHSYLASDPPELATPEAQSALSVFARIVPELRDMRPNLSLAPALNPRQEQIRLMRAAGTLIILATRQRPWLVILDDLHWADGGTIELLRYLGHLLPSVPLLIISTYRAHDVDSRHPLSPTLQQLAERPGYIHIELQPLDEPATATLLSQIWERSVPPDLASPIHQHTGGSPFYIEAVARSMGDDGLVRADPATPLPTPEALQLPETMRDVVWRRLHHLSPDTLTLLRQAAVLGPTFGFALLCELSKQGERKVLGHLDTALERQLVREASSEGTLSFSHAEIHIVLYRDLGATRRKRLHRDAAAAIVRLAAGDTSYYAAELARHYEEAELFTEAFDQSVIAARQAAALFVNDSALNWYRRIIDMVDRLDPNDAATRYKTLIEIYTELGETLYLVGGWDEALPIYQQALSLAEDLGDRHSQAHFQDQIGYLLVRQGIYQEASFWIEQARGNYEALNDRAGLASIYKSQGMQASALGHYEQGIALYQRSLTLQRELGDQQKIAGLLNNIAIDVQNQGDLAEARRTFIESLTILQELGDQRDSPRVYANLGYLAIIEGSYELACQQLTVGLAIANETGDPAQCATLHHNLGIALQGLGEQASARQAYLEALAIYLDLGDQAGLTYLLEDIASHAALEGDPERALRLCGAAAALRDELGIPLPQLDSTRLEQTIAPAREALGAQAASLTQAGRELSLEEAIALARNPRPEPAITTG